MTRPILVIDDEPDMCWVMQQILLCEGHQSDAVTTAQDALARVGQRAYWCALVDLKLPDMDGRELVRQLRTVCPALPCVLVTGYLYTDDEAVQADLSAGVIVGFIAKPFTIEQIRGVLATIPTPGVGPSSAAAD